jgi:hypothetical protein
MGVIGTQIAYPLNGGILFPHVGNESLNSVIAISGSALNSTATTWPSANRAIYIPVPVTDTITIYQMAVRIQTQSGNLDVGIYDYNGNRLVSAGSTAMAAAGVQTFNVADTTLVPGWYHMAVNVSNTTAVLRGHTAGSGVITNRVGGGVQQQDVGATALPATATFATMTGTWTPLVVAVYRSTTF